MDSEETYWKHGFNGLSEVAAVNIETTGLDPENNRIIRVTAMRFNLNQVPKQGGEVETKVFETLIDPGVPIPQEATKIHGIQDTDLKDAPKFHEVAQELRDFIGTRVLIGHNISFDKGFLSQEFKRAKVKTLYRNKSRCTMGRMKELRECTGDGWYNSSLTDTAKALGVKEQNELPGHLQKVQFVVGIATLFYRLDNNLASYKELFGKELPNEEFSDEELSDEELSDEELFETPPKKGCATAALMLVAVTTAAILALVRI